MMKELKSLFSELPNASNFIGTLIAKNVYFDKEFDRPYDFLASLFSINDMENRVLEDEGILEKRYKNQIESIHSMEGHTLIRVASRVRNHNFDAFLGSQFFSLGIPSNHLRKNYGFRYFESQLMFEGLDISRLKKYMESLFSEQHLEIMQCTYTLAKASSVNSRTIQKLVVTNPYTKGLKDLMMAFAASNVSEKRSYFQRALGNLAHIKYYYLEALYYYCLFLKANDDAEFDTKVNEGLADSQAYFYQYLVFLFNRLKVASRIPYTFTYSFYPIAGLEGFVEEHDRRWEAKFKEAGD
jgi:hypothetical protein